MENNLLQQDLAEVRENFKIENLESANWAFRKLRAIEEKENEVKELAENEIVRIKDWEFKELDQYKRDKEYFNYLLEEYYKSEKAQNSKFKLTTPYGKVSSRKSIKWIYEDEKALLDYFKNNNSEMIRIKEELDKTAIKSNYKEGADIETGELLPGVKIENVETISIKVE